MTLSQRFYSKDKPWHQQPIVKALSVPGVSSIEPLKNKEYKKAAYNAVRDTVNWIPPGYLGTAGEYAFKKVRDYNKDKNINPYYAPESGKAKRKAKIVKEVIKKGG